MKLPLPLPGMPQSPPAEDTESPLASALRLEIPSNRIARRIAEMLHATRQTPTGQVEVDWPTVEAGLRLYVELTAAQETVRIPHPPAGEHKVPDPLVPVEPVLEEIKKDPSRKHPLSRTMESKDALRYFMLVPRSTLARRLPANRVREALTAVSSVSRPSATAPGTPSIILSVPPAPSASPWLMAVSILIGAGLVAYYTGIASHSVRQPAPPLPPMDWARSTTLPPTPGPLKPAGAEAPPRGWTSKAAYDAWSPKFEADLSID